MQGMFSEMDADIGWNDFALRNYDPQIGRWIQQDPYQQFASPYIGMGNDPVNGIDPSGGVYFVDNMMRASISMTSVIGASVSGASIVAKSSLTLFSKIGFITKGLQFSSYFLGSGPTNQAGYFDLIKGRAAHRAFGQYIKRVDPEGINWTFNESMAIGAPLRPDLVYGFFSEYNKGVWEIKPDFPSMEAIKAGFEATIYAQGLNYFNNSTKFYVGITGGAPAPFEGILYATDSKTGMKFSYRLNGLTGAIYYKEVGTSPRKSPVKDPAPVPEPSPSLPDGVPYIPFIFSTDKIHTRSPAKLPSPGFRFTPILLGKLFEMIFNPDFLNEPQGIQ